MEMGEASTGAVISVVDTPDVVADPNMSNAPGSLMIPLDRVEGW